MNDTVGFEEIRLGIIEVWHKRLLCIVVAAIFFLVGILATMTMSEENTYRAQSSVYSAVFGSYEESVDAASAMQRYADVVTSAKVCERAASIVKDENLTVSQIQSMVSVGNASSNVVMTIYATSTDSELAVQVANAVAEAFVIEIRSITGTDAIQLLDEAERAFLSKNGSRDILMYRLLAFVGGGVITAAIIFLTTMFSDKLRSLNQIENMGEPIVALIPYMTESEGK